MQSFQQVIMIGNLGADPEIRSMGNGDRVANLRLCVNESYKDRNTGEWKQKPQWFRLFTWSPATVAFIERNLFKGRYVQIVGTLDNKSYTQNGETKYTTEIRISQITLLDRVEREDQQTEQHQAEDDPIPF
ncbi:single-stranded DNA-binding protein [Caulobacter sp. X]|uniref:single-stranded DNA-binding protein n=1 Tax=Caulobacter sp. X TaxID=2048901 RepID=UPI000C15901E|nr:single-stranded DNA-binding protein [Caulobacter sp. X]PIB95283.1 single-stranded DNA-binding protein [Caulobacter sp. X]